MSPLDGDLLRLLSHMPLLDRMEMAALSGWSGGASTGRSAGWRTRG